MLSYYLKRLFDITFSAYLGRAVLKPDFLGLNSGSVCDMLSGPGHVPQPLCAPFLPVPISQNDCGGENAFRTWQVLLIMHGWCIRRPPELISWLFKWVSFLEDWRNTSRIGCIALKVSSSGKGQVQKHWYSFLSYNASNFMFFLFLGSNFNTLLILLTYFLCPLMLLLFISASFIDNYLPKQRVI